MNKKLILSIFFIICLSSIVSAAEIKGKIYDIELNIVNNAKIEINTIPKQVLIASDGVYSFNLAPGTYTIIATYPPDDLKIIEHITVKEQGSYNLDLILWPNLDVEEEILDEISTIDIADVFVEEDANSLGRLGIAVILTVLIGVVIFIWYKFKSKTEEIKKQVEKNTKKVKEKQKPVLDKELNKLYQFIKQEEGRTTQKDIRKNFPQSEAKISLMIAELEDKGIIKKIKKGRGNIIVLE